MRKNIITQLLINDNSLIFSPKLALAIGLNEAIILQQIHYWLLKSKNEHENKPWMYNSIVAWNEQFPFLSANTIRRTLNNLKKTGLIRVGNYNKAKYDRTLWYTIDYPKLVEFCSHHSIIVNPILHENPMDVPTVGKPIPETTQRLTQDIPDTNSQSENTTSPNRKDSRKQNVLHANDIYEYYGQKIRNGARSDAINNIAKLLTSYSKEVLINTIDNYVLSGLPEESQFRIQANNFFGRKERFKDYFEKPTASTHQFTDTVENDPTFQALNGGSSK